MRTGILSIGVLLVTVTVARGQFSVAPGQGVPAMSAPNMGLMLSLRSTQRYVTSHHLVGQSATKPPPTPATPPARVQAETNTAALLFTSDPAVSQQVRADVLARWKSANPGQEQQIEAAFARNDFLSAYAGLVGAYGLNPHNLADTITAYMIVNWGLVHGVTTIGQPIVSAAQRQIAALAGQLPMLRTLSPAQKQMLAENMEYLTVLVQAQRTNADPAARQRAAEHARQEMRQMGFDVDKMNLTASGFLFPPG